MDIVRAATQLVGFALVPVVLARGAACGGGVRPAEFPIGHLGMLALFVGLVHWPSLGVLVSNGPGRGFLFSGETVQRINFLAQLTIGMVAIFAVVFGRRVLPGWVLTLCLWVAWLQLRQTGEGAWREGMNGVLMEFDSIWLRRSLGMVVNELPWSFPTSIPVVAAVIGMIGPRTARRTWVEWVGVTLVPIWIGSAESRRLAHQHSLLPASEFAIELVATLLIWMVSMTLSVAIVRRHGPAFGRWLGARPQESGPA